MTGDWTVGMKVLCGGPKKLDPNNGSFGRWETIGQTIGALNHELIVVGNNESGQMVFQGYVKSLSFRIPIVHHIEWRVATSPFGVPDSSYFDLDVRFLLDANMFIVEPSFDRENMAAIAMILHSTATGWPDKKKRHIVILKNRYSTELNPVAVVLMLLGQDGNGDLQLADCIHWANTADEVRGLIVKLSRGELMK